MTDTQQGKVICGKCGSPLQGPVGDNPEDVFSCPNCGNSDTRAKVLEEVNAFVTDSAARELQAQAKDVARRSRIITYTEKRSFPEREYRFKWKAD